MPPAAHPGRRLKRELGARNLSASRLALDLGVPSGRITDILQKAEIEKWWPIIKEAGIKAQ
jgi:plasmid maintenance system antidote protein VapI